MNPPTSPSFPFAIGSNAVTRPDVPMPPRQPVDSMSSVLAPSRAAETAAAAPAGPRLNLTAREAGEAAAAAGARRLLLTHFWPDNDRLAARAAAEAAFTERWGHPLLADATGPASLSAASDTTKGAGR